MMQFPGHVWVILVVQFISDYFRNSAETASLPTDHAARGCLYKIGTVFAKRRTLCQNCSQFAIAFTSVT